MKQAFTPDAYMDSLYGTVFTSPYRNVTDGVEAEAVALRLKERLSDVLGYDRIPLKKMSAPVLLGAPEERGAYRQTALSVEILEGFSMLCYLLVPTEPTGKPTGVVALPGHGYGARQILGQTKNGNPRSFPFLDDYQKSFAVRLAERGNAVIVPELMGFGQSRMKKDIHKPFYSSSCAALSHRLLAFGLTLAAFRVYQTICCADILLKTAGCRADRLGVMGISGGGLTALYASVLDTRFTDIVISGYVNTFKDSILSVKHCPDNYFPGILRIGEIYDFAASLAPRRLLLECGEKDKIFPLKGSREAIANIGRVYGLFDATEQFSYDIFDGKHRISGKMSFDYFGETVC